MHLNRRQHSGKPARARREGVAAIEFAMVAIPFLALIFAVMELAMIFVTDSILENATLEASRVVRTGQADTQGITASQFRTALCSHMSIFSADCPSRASIDVRVVPQFRNAPPPNPITNTGAFDPNALTYLPGNPGDLVVIRVWYRQTLITPVLSQALSRLSTGEALLTVTTAFRNEPYDG